MQNAECKIMEELLRNSFINKGFAVRKTSFILHFEFCILHLKRLYLFLRQPPYLSGRQVA